MVTLPLFTVLYVCIVDIVHNFDLKVSIRAALTWMTDFSVLNCHVLLQFTRSLFSILVL